MHRSVLLLLALAACTSAYCGDGVLNDPNREQCDLGLRCVAQNASALEVRFAYAILEFVAAGTPQQVYGLHLTYNNTEAVPPGEHSLACTDAGALVLELRRAADGAAVMRWTHATAMTCAQFFSGNMSVPAPSAFEAHWGGWSMSGSGAAYALSPEVPCGSVCCTAQCMHAHWATEGGACTGSAEPSNATVEYYCTADGACVDTQPVAAAFTIALCGNGNLDAGEPCDEGYRKVGGGNRLATGWSNTAVCDQLLPFGLALTNFMGFFLSTYNPNAVSQIPTWAPYYSDTSTSGFVPFPYSVNHVISCTATFAGASNNIDLQVRPFSISAGDYYLVLTFRYLVSNIYGCNQGSLFWLRAPAITFVHAIWEVHTPAGVSTSTTVSSLYDMILPSTAETSGCCNNLCQIVGVYGGPCPRTTPTNDAFLPGYTCNAVGQCLVNPTQTRTSSPSNTGTPTQTPSGTGTRTPTPSPTETGTPSLTTGLSPSGSATASQTPSSPPTTSQTPTSLPTTSQTRTPTRTPASASVTRSVPASHSSTQTPSGTHTPQATQTASATRVPVPFTPPQMHTTETLGVLFGSVGACALWLCGTAVALMALRWVAEHTPERVIVDTLLADAPQY